MRTIRRYITVLILASALQSCTTPTWKQSVSKEVQAMGYGNWIIVADASYPFQEQKGMRTISVDEEIPVIVDQVIQAMGERQHTKPSFFLPRELRSVRNDQAPGIDYYRQDLQKVIEGYSTRELELTMLNNLVAESAEKYTVLIIKSRTALPYSSVFLDLDSGYWDSYAEQELRARIKAENAVPPSNPVLE